jgi:hypothetical protein
VTTRSHHQNIEDSKDTTVFNSPEERQRQIQVCPPAPVFSQLPPISQAMSQFNFDFARSSVSSGIPFPNSYYQKMSGVNGNPHNQPLVPYPPMPAFDGRYTANLNAASRPTSVDFSHGLISTNSEPNEPNPDRDQSMQANPSVDQQPNNSTQRRGSRTVTLVPQFANEAVEAALNAGTDMNLATIPSVYDEDDDFADLYDISNTNQPNATPHANPSNVSLPSLRAHRRVTFPLRTNGPNVHIQRMQEQLMFSRQQQQLQEEGTLMERIQEQMLLSRHMQQLESALNPFVQASKPYYTYRMDKQTQIILPVPFKHTLHPVSFHGLTQGSHLSDSDGKSMEIKDQMYEFEEQCEDFERAMQPCLLDLRRGAIVLPGSNSIPCCNMNSIAVMELN